MLMLAVLPGCQVDDRDVRQLRKIAAAFKIPREQAGAFAKMQTFSQSDDLVAARRV